MFNRIFNFILLFAVSFSLSAQDELGLHFMRDVWQSNQSNPAIFSENKINVALPNLYFNIFHTGAAFDNIVKKDGEGQSFFNVDDAINSMEADNFLKVNVRGESLGFAVQLKNVWQLSFQHGARFDAYINYPKEMAQLAWNGNAQFVGETIEFGPDIQISAYNEFAFGLARQLGKLTVGAKAKILTGIADVSTSRTHASLYTDPDIYQLTFDTDYRINASSLDGIDGLSLDFDALKFNFNDFGFNPSNFSASNLFSSNLGFALDFGLTYQVTEKLQLAASVVDLGKINWEENTKNFTSNGNTTYDGLDVSAIINDNSVSFEETIDTLDQILGFEESTGAYSTNLPTKFYASAMFDFNEKWRFGALFYTEKYRDETFPAFALSANTKFGKIFSVGAAYTIRNSSFDNLGVNIAATVGPAQLYVLTDNIVAAIDPYGSRNANVRVGINLLFGNNSTVVAEE